MPTLTTDPELTNENIKNPFCCSGSSPTPDSHIPLTDKPTEEILTSRAVAVMLGRNHKTIERHARDGAIPGHFRLGRWYFLKSELDSWLRSELDSSRQPCRVN